MKKIGLMTTAAVVAMALYGCGSSPTPAPSAAASPSQVLLDPSALCKQRVGNGVPVRFGAASYLGGIMLGSGSTGVVLAHRNGSDLCDWLPYGHVLAEKGYRVLAFDFAEFGSSNPRPDPGTIADDMTAAAEYLRSQGASALVLMGASMGGTAALAVATTLQPPVAGAVTLSAPGGFEGVNANTAALSVPALYIAGSGDGGYAQIAQYLADQTPHRLGTLLVVDSPNHGTDMLDDPAVDKQIRQAIETFLAAHAPVTG
jgi:predicted alpha/beta-hydrolase family hydrolase